MMRNWLVGLALSTLILMGSCKENGLSTAEIQEEAKERVREQLGLTEEAALFTEMFVGKPLDGDTIVCGRVGGRRADGTVIVPRRFIAATDPGRWVKFEPVTDSTLPSRPQKFVEWYGTCESKAEGIATG
ncbi:hypothetical protein [Sphingosinicella rhizophila]|uniref:Uncharacterized protein n=1 Tax=Sphingosinicella rhizophila TaxID=3050082 RepID=A0ABU3Q9Q1_9SPHN|nr:hypothetical protein [Sphingosinicella sp. GR2756]MDT9600138.1 hypothetical protein [Sphingosinicella sp. GR2756]